MDAKETLKVVVLDNINFEGMIAAAITKALDPALQKVVDSTTNPFDNMLKAAVAPELEKALAEELLKLVAHLKA